MLECWLAERQQIKLDAGREVPRALREVRSPEVRCGSDRRHHVCDQRQVEHLLDRDPAQHAAPALDRFCLLVRQTVALVLERPLREQVLAHDHVLKLAGLRQQPPQILTMGDDYLGLGSGHIDSRTVQHHRRILVSAMSLPPEPLSTRSSYLLGRAASAGAGTSLFLEPLWITPREYSVLAVLAERSPLSQDAGRRDPPRARPHHDSQTGRIARAQAIGRPRARRRRRARVRRGAHASPVIAFAQRRSKCARVRSTVPERSTRKEREHLHDLQQA